MSTRKGAAAFNSAAGIFHGLGRKTTGSAQPGRPQGSKSKGKIFCRDYGTLATEVYEPEDAGRLPLPPCRPSSPARPKGIPADCEPQAGHGR
jgi:hypothetical protein